MLVLAFQNEHGVGSCFLSLKLFFCRLHSLIWDLYFLSVFVCCIIEIWGLYFLYFEFSRNCIRMILFFFCMFITALYL